MVFSFTVSPVIHPGSDDRPVFSSVFYCLAWKLSHLGLLTVSMFNVSFSPSDLQDKTDHEPRLYASLLFWCACRYIRDPVSSLGRLFLEALACLYTLLRNFRLRFLSRGQRRDSLIHSLLVVVIDQIVKENLWRRRGLFEPPLSRLFSDSVTGLPLRASSRPASFPGDQCAGVFR